MRGLGELNRRGIKETSFGKEVFVFVKIEFNNRRIKAQRLEKGDDAGGGGWGCVGRERGGREKEREEGRRERERELRWQLDVPGQDPVLYQKEQETPSGEIGRAHV